MPSNTSTSVQSNETFATSAVALVVGVLNTTSWGCGVGMNYAEITTVVTGAPASFTVLLEGAVDGATWVTLATCTNTAGETQFSTGLIPFVALRARCTAVSGGTTPTVNCVVTVSQTAFINTGGGTAPGNRTIIVGSVDNSQVVNRYGSIANSGVTAAAPTAGAAIATLAVFDFYYEVRVLVGFGATAEITTVDNFVLKAGATTIATIPVANVANTQSQLYRFFVNPGGSVNLTVNVGGTNGSAGSLYKATVIATRLV